MGSSKAEKQEGHCHGGSSKSAGPESFESVDIFFFSNSYIEI